MLKCNEKIIKHKVGLLNLAEELGNEGGTFHGCARDAAVVVHLRERDPTLVLLAEDIGLAGLARRVP